MKYLILVLILSGCSYNDSEMRIFDKKSI